MAAPMSVNMQTANLHSFRHCRPTVTGANSYGQLGQNHQDDKLIPDALSFVPGKPEFLSGGGGHSLVIIDGGIYSCGSNNKGQLGIGHKNDASTLQFVSALRDVRVIKVSGGWDFSLALSDKGDVYSWGSNAFGQLGCSGQETINTPEKLAVGERKIKDIACGLRHTIFLTETGNVLCCGAGRKGQLGHGIGAKLEAKVHQPTEVILPDECGKATQVTAGAYHSAALTDKGRIVIWGDNKHGQCCLDPGTEPIVPKPRLIPQKMFENKAVSELHSGWTHLLAKTADSNLFSWGRNDYGQLGRSSSVQNAKFDYLPKMVPTPVTKQVVCGSEHNLVLSETGVILSWGWNEHGMCGTGGEENLPSPGSIEALKRHKVGIIGSGHGHSMASLTEDLESR